MHTFNRMMTVAMAMVVGVGVATAQANPFTPSQPRTPSLAPPIKGVVKADYVQAVDKNGNLVGPRIALKKGGSGSSEGPPWVMMWDAMNVDPTTGTPFSGTYGPNPPNYWFGATFHNPFFANQMNTNPAAVGRFATRITQIAYWGPSGSVGGGGAGDLTLLYLSDNWMNGSVDNTNSLFVNLLPSSTLNTLGGVALTYSALPDGGWILDSGDLAPFGLGVPGPQSGPNLPAFGIEGGALRGYFGQIVGGFFVPPTGGAVVQPGIGNMLELARGFGTNPSGSSWVGWDDDVIIDHDHMLTLWGDPVSELYTYDFGGGFGVLEYQYGLFADNAAVQLNGTVNWNDIGDPTRRPTEAEFQLTGIDGSDQPIPGAEITWTLNVDQNTGAFNVIHPRLGGTDRYIVSMKESTFLRRNIIVDFSGGSVAATMDMINGDANNDNEVSGQDFVLLDAAFNTEAGDAGYNIDADFNKDDVVDGLDFVILDSNFNEEGDPDPTP
jgi:hypothetical protein